MREHVAPMLKGGGGERRLYEAMAYVLEGGGKGLRGFLVLSSSALFDVPRAYALRVAAAVELVHSYSLVHDDLPSMDDDDLRRGRVTCHKRYDEATAILVGDALLTLAFEILAQDKTHPDALVRCRLIESLARKSGAQGMVGGQMADIVAQNGTLASAEITSMQEMKTGALLFFSCVSGGILADAKQADRRALEAYARAIGLAFQIADDILDETGDEKTLGKRAGKDKDAAKATFVALLGLDGAKAKAQELIDEAIAQMARFGKKGQTMCHIAQFIIDRRK
ncbi:MAG: polyprenyl synthetase family protein [Alphaproteobacteria bacterium GM202ARS2]|nr:polyprenyl synthetase family protein [Alphaproteobacteria bacterium GM202ARS2]